MTSLLLAASMVAALAFESPAAQVRSDQKENDRFVAIPVKSFVIGADGQLEVLDDQGIAWVTTEKGLTRPLQLLDVLGPRRYIGLQLLTLTPELRRHFGVPADRGVMVSKVLEDTPAARAGIEVGDVLIAADGSPVAAASDITRVLSGKEPGQEVRLELWRGGEPTSLTVAFEDGETMPFGAGAPGMRRARVLRDRVKIPIETKGPGSTIAIRALHQEDLDDALRALDEYFRSGEWQERVKQLQSLDLNQIQLRMKTLERRLQELERELAER
ncbi:MAG TPA: PDZ domain-containing protein [Thermoanaerobaculia bacterium]|nr:PDZ domain-containing protein [Thermoanaerobaculia bacterium]